jgi:hypothetical protein
MKAYEQTVSLLGSLQLRGIAGRLDEEITDAESRKASYLTFLQALLDRLLHHARVFNLDGESYRLQGKGVV